MAAGGEGERLIVGNRDSKIYHLTNCLDYLRVSERNRVPFKT